MGSSRLLILTAITALVSSTSILGQQFDGQIRQFVQQGAWCWFQDERAVIDTVKNKLVIGSANMQSGIDLTVFNLETMQSEGSKRFGGLEYSDDHNSPGLIIAPNGNYVALWAHHYDSKHHYSIYKDGSGWSNEKSVQWSKWGNISDCKVAYSNLYYLSDEERIYCFSRVFDRAPNFIYSDDNGENWDYGSQLTTNSSNTYNKGYYKYWGNGKDRIDMCFTEEHPRDQTTSIYHGYIQGHKTYNSAGELADEDIYTKDKIPTFEEFTKVFEHNTEVKGAKMGRCWQHDICSYDDGTIVILFKARADDDYTDHRNFYARYDGSKWNITYLGKAGTFIYGNEYDYVGLGSINPDDPNRIYLCTTYNPGDDNSSPSSKREIWRGTSKDEGETWEWEAITSNSGEDNFRPIVPKWKPGKEAVLWFQGKYISAQNIPGKVLGTFYEYEYVPPVTISKKNKTQNSQNSTFNCMPNSGNITVNYQMQNPTTAKLTVFSLSGKEVATLVNSVKSNGQHTFNWNTNSTPAGTYLVRLSVGSQSYLERVTIQR